MRSTRYSSRARTTNERGFALLWAIGLAVLFFMMIQLVLMESGLELKEAQLFRSRIVAMVLAENGAELAAAQIVDTIINNPEHEDWQGKVYGTMTRNELNEEFTIVGTGETAGTHRTKAVVEVRGVIDKVTNPTQPNIQILLSKHTP